MQAGHQAVQGGQGEDVRRELALSPQSDQTEFGLLTHAQRAESYISQRRLCGRPVPDHQGRRRRLLEKQFWQQVSKGATNLPLESLNTLRSLYSLQYIGALEDIPTGAQQSASHIIWLGGDGTEDDHRSDVQ